MVTLTLTQLVIGLIGCQCHAFVVPAPNFVIRAPKLSLLEPQGLRMAYPHENGMTLFAVHYNLNKPLHGVDAGDYNFDVTSATNGEWVHENRKLVVKPGDTIYYWLLVVHNGAGHQLTDQSWRPTGPTSATPTLRTTRNPSPGPTTTRPTKPTTTRSTKPTDKPPTPGPTGRPVPDDECPGGVYPCVVFEDQFKKLDFSKWQHEITAGGGGNWEFQYYTNNRTNSYVRDGVLFLKPTLTSDQYGEAFLSSGSLEIWGSAPANLCTGNQWWGCSRQGTGTNYINPIQSARLRSVHGFSLQYGRVEVEAKLPAGDWIWPAIWMLPKHEEYGRWPASGEIDIMEGRGNRNLKNKEGKSVGVDHAGSTMHWGPFYGYNGFAKTQAWKTLQGTDFNKDFHKFEVEWDPEYIKFFLDGQQLLNVDPGAGGFWKYGEFDKSLPKAHNPWIGGAKMAPFDTRFYMVMNVAVGGTGGYFDDTMTNTPHPKPWNNKSPTAPREFWNAKNQWYPTWNADKNNGEDAAMQVKYVRVWKLKPPVH